MIDMLLVLVIAIVTWCVASEGPWGAALTCLSVILGGLLAMNFFEPLASFLEQNVAGGDWAYRWDVIALIGLCTVCVLLFRLVTDQILPTYVMVQRTMHEVGRWGAGLLTGYVTAGFLLAALHTAPLPRDFWGFKPERDNLFNMAAPDRQWLGFVQYVSEKSLAQGGGGENARIFDGARALMGDPESPYPNDVWPSFPIRYAVRRDEFAGMSDPSADGGGFESRSRDGGSSSGPGF